MNGSSGIRVWTSLEKVVLISVLFLIVDIFFVFPISEGEKLTQQVFPTFVLAQWIYYTLIDKQI